MENTSQFASAIGRKEMAFSLGVGVTAISNAVVAGSFPAAWFDTLEALAESQGKECPRHLFAWRRAETSEDAA